MIGVSDSTVSRYRSSGSEISPDSKAGELALLLVRVFRSRSTRWSAPTRSCAGVDALAQQRPGRGAGAADPQARWPHAHAVLPGWHARRGLDAGAGPRRLAGRVAAQRGHRPGGAWVWRGVETQYASSSLQLVDSHAEHDALELLLEGSKPPLQDEVRGQHFLLFTPFRYTPGQPSRFRAAGHLGIWYGARELKAACAEVAYWRMRFILDSVGLLQRKITTRHTFFMASVKGRGIDLTTPPWDAFAPAWL